MKRLYLFFIVILPAIAFGQIELIPPNAQYVFEFGCYGDHTVVRLPGPVVPQITENADSTFTVNGVCVPTCDALNAIVDGICDDNSRPVSRVNVKNEGTVYVETDYKNPVDSIVYIPNQVGEFCASATATNDAIEAAFANSPIGQPITGCPGATATWIPGTGLIFGGTNDFTDYSGVFVVYSVNDCDPAQVVTDKAQFRANEPDLNACDCGVDGSGTLCGDVLQAQFKIRNTANTAITSFFVPTGANTTDPCGNATLGSLLLAAYNNIGTPQTSGLCPGVTVTITQDGPAFGSGQPLYDVFIDVSALTAPYAYNFPVRIQYDCDTACNMEEVFWVTCDGKTDETACPGGIVLTATDGTRWCQTINPDGDIITTLIP